MYIPNIVCLIFQPDQPIDLRVKELGMEHIAITDHGVMFGIIDFYKQAVAEGIKPIIGCEVYIAARGLEQKDPRKDQNQSHLVLLQRTKEAMTI